MEKDFTAKRWTDDSGGAEGVELWASSATAWEYRGRRGLEAVVAGEPMVW